MSTEAKIDLKISTKLTKKLLPHIGSILKQLTASAQDSEDDAEYITLSGKLVAQIQELQCVLPTNLAKKLDKAIVYLIKEAAANDPATPDVSSALSQPDNPHICWAVSQALSDNTQFIDALIILNRPKILAAIDSYTKDTADGTSEMPLIEYALTHKRYGLAVSLLTKMNSETNQESLLTRLLDILASEQGSTADASPHSPISTLLTHACSNTDAIEKYGLRKLNFEQCRQLFLLTQTTATAATITLDDATLNTLKQQWRTTTLCLPAASDRDDIECCYSAIQQSYQQLKEFKRYLPDTLMTGKLSDLLDLVLKPEILLSASTDLPQLTDLIDFIFDNDSCAKIKKETYQSTLYKLITREDEAKEPIVIAVINQIAKWQPPLLSKPVILHETVTHLAAAFDLTEILHCLKTHDETLLLTPGIVGLTPIHMLALNGNTETLLTIPLSLLQQANQTSLPPIHCAATRGDTETVSALINKHPSENLLALKVKNRQRDTCLNFIRIDEPISDEANPSIHTTLVICNGHTPAHCAALKGHLSTLVYINSVNPDLLREEDRKGNTPADLARDQGHDAVAKAIEKMLEDSPSASPAAASHSTVTLSDESRELAIQFNRPDGAAAAEPTTTWMLVTKLYNTTPKYSATQEGFNELMVQYNHDVVENLAGICDMQPKESAIALNKYIIELSHFYASILPEHLMEIIEFVVIQLYKLVKITSEWCTNENLKLKQQAGIKCNHSVDGSTPEPATLFFKSWITGAPATLQKNMGSLLEIINFKHLGFLSQPFFSGDLTIATQAILHGLYDLSVALHGINPMLLRNTYKNNQTVAHIAAIDGKTKCFNTLHELDRDLLTQTDEFGLMPADLARTHRHTATVEIIRKLLTGASTAKPTSTSAVIGTLFSSESPSARSSSDPSPAASP